MIVEKSLFHSLGETKDDTIDNNIYLEQNSTTQWNAKLEVATEGRDLLQHPSSRRKGVEF